MILMGVNIMHIQGMFVGVLCARIVSWEKEVIFLSVVWLVTRRCIMATKKRMFPKYKRKKLGAPGYRDLVFRTVKILKTGSWDGRFPHYAGAKGFVVNRRGKVVK